METPINAQLRAIRQAAGIPAARLARPLDLTLPTLTAKERGVRPFRDRELRSYLHRLKGIIAARDNQALRKVALLRERDECHGAALRRVREIADLSYGEVAGQISRMRPERPVNAETLRAREMNQRPWRLEEALWYLNAVDALVRNRGREAHERLLLLTRSQPD